MAELNAAFQNQLLQFIGKQAGPRAVNTHIEFRLACVAQPSVGTSWTNNSEPGVMRYVSNNSSVLNQVVLNSSTYNPMLAITHPSGYNCFPFSKYLNVWCVSNICGSAGCPSSPPSVIGYGTFPWLGLPIDGIVMRTDCIGNNNYPTNFSMFSYLDKGAVLAHEAGHYLGLYHTFESMPTAGGSLSCYGTTATSALTDGDLIYDTPPTNVASDLGAVTVYNSCHETYAPYGGIADENDQLENMMCYSDDDKLNTFTQNQATRLYASIDASYGGASATRTVLVSSANLLATGVAPASCSTGILTGIFNYSYSPGASCGNVGVQFTNPTSTGFTATSWTWNFGDSNTGTGASPTHTYTGTGTSYTVTCTASNGTATATYSTIVNANFQVHITGQSGTTVCRGSEQTVYITFAPGVPSAIITDGTTQTLITNYMSQNTTVIIPYTFVCNSNVSYSLVPAYCGTLNLGSASFSVIDCCESLVNNGDFSAGQTGFYTDLYPGVSSTFYGTYQVNTPSNTSWLNWVAVSTQNITGNAMIVDGFQGNNTIVNIAGPTCSSAQKPIIWSQTVTGLQPNTNYYYSFKLLENFNPQWYNQCKEINYETSILSGPGIYALTSQTLSPIRAITPSKYDYVVYTYTFTTASGVTPSTTFTININQINHFDGSYFDFFLDNIRLNQMTPGIQATGSQTICPGQTAQLGAVANCNNVMSNFNYGWTPTTGLSCTTCTNPIASPSATTVYTLVATPTTNTTSGTPAIVSTVTVTVASGPTPTVSLTSSNQYPCLGTSITLTASVLPAGTYTYTWGAPLSASTQTVTTSPTDNYVYTCNVLSQCGVAASASTCVNVVSNRCCTATENITNYTITSHGTYSYINNVPYDLVGTITIAGIVSWNNTDFRMQVGAKIVIQPGASLTLSNAKLFSCQGIWEGITVQSNGTTSGSLTVNNGTSIEDAYRAIYYDAANTSYPNNLVIEGADINKNYIGVSINNTTGGTNYNTFEYSTYRSTASTTSPGSNLKCSSFYTPVIRSRGYIGWQSNNILGEILIGPTSTPTTSISNAFDNLDYGYYGTNAVTRIHFCSFNNMTGTNLVMFPPPTTPGIGIGVYATATNTNSPYAHRVSESSFSNVWRGIETKAIGNITATNNTYTNTVTSSGTCSGGCVGNAAIYLTNTSQLVEVSSNSISNSMTGIGAYYSQVVPASTFSLGIGTNTINATGTSTNVIAIDLEDAVNTFSTAGAVMQIAANTISNTNDGIYVLNVKNGLRVSGNTIGIQYASTGNRYGIRLNGAQNVTVDNNTATCTSTANASIRGIYMQLSPNCLTQCNTVNTVGQSIVFEGNCLTTIRGFLNNTMNNANDGLVLKTNGVIGQQGNPGGTQRFSSGNKWTGSFTRSKTIVYDIGSSSTNSKLYVLNNTNENPLPQTLNIVLPGSTGNNGTDNYGTSTYNSPASILAITYGNVTCPATLTVALKPAQADVMSIQEKEQQDSSLWNLVTGLDSNAVLYGETNTINQQYVFDQMAQGYTTQHAGLNAFYAANQSTDYGHYSDIDSLVLSGDFSAASSANSSAPINTNVSQNAKTVNGYLLQYLQNPAYAFSQSDIDDLTTIAHKCPLADGNAVYQSRALLSIILNHSLQFSDSCGSEDAGLYSKGTNTTSPQRQESYLLFPNPNNGSMTLAYTAFQRAQLTIFDLQGRLIFKQTLQPDNHLLSISLDMLNQGIYHYSIIGDNGTVLKTDKLVIIK